MPVFNFVGHLITIPRRILCRKRYSELDESNNKKILELLNSGNDRKIGSIKYKTHIFIDINYNLPRNVSQEASESLKIYNAGGKSEISEMYSMDYFVKRYNAKNIIFEKQVRYWIDYKMVDFICTINDERVGVSVARAMLHPKNKYFTETMGENLLYKKLYGLIVARNGVVKEQNFYKSILHIWCETAQIANIIKSKFENLDENDYGLDVKGIILLILTVCDDEKIYKNT